MKSFISVVNNYEKVYRIGKEIIKHKELVRKSCPKKLDEEFRKQEFRIEQFIKATETADKEWKKNPYSINPYWTGYS